MNWLLGQDVPKKDEVLSSFGKADKDSLPKNFQVLIWNIYKGRKKDFESEYKNLTSDSHLILLQEMQLSEDLLSIYQNYLEWNHATNFLKKSVNNGVGTGSITKSLNVDFRVTDDLEPWIKLPKTIVITEYFIQGSKENLLVLNIHGINFKGTEGLINQINQVIKVISNHKGPVIFAGDFNTKNSERYEVLEKMLNEVGLKSVIWENHIGKQLDHAFYRGLNIVNAKILDEVKGSDHPALFLNINYEN